MKKSKSKGGTKIAVVAIVLLVIACGALFFVMSDDNEPAATNSQSNEVVAEVQESESTVDSSESEEAILSDALVSIGATGNEGPVNGVTYTYEGIEYKFEEPINWETSMSQRKEACEQGYINTGYQVATDGNTWFAATDSNDDYIQLVTAFKRVGVKVTVDNYCI